VANLFDGLQKNLVNTINNFFGYMVDWTPSGSEETITAKCLYSDPTKKFELGEIDYSPNLFQMEYHKDDLPGLWQSSREGNAETVFIYEIGADPETAIEYAVMKAGAGFDGKTYQLIIEKVY
jgi:hypothetical protein